MTLESNRTLLGGLLLDPSGLDHRTVLRKGAQRPRGAFRRGRSGAPVTRIAEGILVLSKDTDGEEGRQ